MAMGLGGSASTLPRRRCWSGENNSSSMDAGSFECNICLDLAQDPIVTRCGHLFCWPCLYKWLHLHSRSRDCPVCKAAVEEEKLVPLYGRGKACVDPRSKSVPSNDIPNRPVAAGHRPGTAPPPPPPPPPPDSIHFPQGGHGAFMPVTTTSLWNLTLWVAFGGLTPSLLNLRVHGFPDATLYGAGAGLPYGFPLALHGGHGFPRPRTNQSNQSASSLKLLYFIVVICVLIALVCQA